MPDGASVFPLVQLSRKEGLMQLDRHLADIASRQRMLITTSDVVAVGGDRDHARTRVRSGRWQRVARGVYLIGGAPFDWHTRQLAAVLAAGPGAAASHLAAARLWGIPGFATAGVEISIPRHRGHRSAEVLVHESRDLDRCSIVDRDSIPVTDAGRMLLDLGGLVGVHRLARSVETARRQKHVTWSSLISTLGVHARRGRPGVQALRHVILSNAHRDEVTDTDMELLVLGLITEAGLPEPAIHVRVLDGDRFVAEVDLAYPQWRIAIECDGSVHLDPAVRERDLARQNDLILAGWIVLRFSYDRVRARPDMVIAEVRAAVTAARSRTGAG